MRLLRSIAATVRGWLFSDPRLTDPVQVAARTAWGEARGDGLLGMHAVLSTIGNRVAQPGWWGRTVLTVCLARAQYSCWTPDTADHDALLAVTTTDPQFRIALVLAQQLVAGTLPDTTFGADSYYALGSPRPAWATGSRYRCTVGSQAFYRVGLAGVGDPLSATDALNATELARVSGAES